MKKKENKAKTTKETKTKKATTAKKPAVKKATTKKKVSAPKVVEVKPEVTEEIKPVEETIPSLEGIKETNVKEGFSFKKPNVSILTIILAISTIVLAILLLTSGPKSNINLTEVFPEVFSETTATMKMPKGFIFSDDSCEFFKEEGGLLKAKGMISVAAYTEEEFTEMKEYFIDGYGATEVEREGYEVLTISQENGEDVYLYYFIYKEGAMIQAVLLNCTEAESNTILNGINF